MENNSQSSGRLFRYQLASTSLSSCRRLKRKLDEVCGDDHGSVGSASNLEDNVNAIVDCGALPVLPEYQQLIVDVGVLPCLVNLLKRHSDGTNPRVVSGVIRIAADAITNLAHHENNRIKTRVRIEGGISPLVELLEFADSKVQRAAAGAFRTLLLKMMRIKTRLWNTMLSYTYSNAEIRGYCHTL